MQTEWPYQVLLILIAAPVGSFLGVLVERLPRGRSILGRSRCDGCGAGLRPANMVPILSALALRGQCGACGAAIPGHLLRIEIAALGTGVLVALTATASPGMFVLAAYLWCLIALFYCDLLWLRLPDALSAALFALGMMLAALDPLRGMADGLLSALVASGVFLGIRVGYQKLRGREGLGLGDVKVMAGIGAAVGWVALPGVTLLAASMGLSIAMIGAFRSRALPDGAERLPLGSYLCAATFIIVLIAQLGLAPMLHF